MVLWIEIVSGFPFQQYRVIILPDTLPHVTELWRDPINGELAIEGELLRQLWRCLIIE